MIRFLLQGSPRVRAYCAFKEAWLYHKYKNRIMNLSKDYSVLINSCDSFEDCWEPFFKLFLKYWPDCDGKLLLNTELKKWTCDYAEIQCTQVQNEVTRRLAWSACLIRALDQVDTPLVLYLQEDYFLHQKVRSDVIRKAVKYMIDNPNVKHIGLTKHGSHGPFFKTDQDWLSLIPQNARYRISTQAGLWRVDTLKSYLRTEEIGWMFEIFGTWRASRRDDTFLCADFAPSEGGAAIDYLHTGIIKGRWLREIKEVFEANGISIDYSRRGFYIPKNPYLHKFEVGSRILKRPFYLLRQYFWRR